MAFLSSMSLFNVLIYFTEWMVSLLAVWGLIHFRPTRRNIGAATMPGTGWLLTAIWLGFLSVALRTAVPVVSWTLEFYGVVVAESVMYATVAAELTSMILALASVYLHFFARWAALDEDERPLWTPLLIGYYPDKKKLVYRTMMKLLRYGK